MPVKNYQFISFKIDGQIWAMPMNKDSQFFTYDHILSLPTDNKYIAGLSYLNGQLVTILNTAKILSLASNKSVNSNQCLLFNYHDDFYALTVESGLELVTVKQVFREKKNKIFSQYIKNNKQKIFIIEPEEIFGLVKIYA